MTDEQILRAFLAGVAPHELIRQGFAKHGPPKEEGDLERLAVQWADDLLEIVQRDTIEAPPMTEPVPLDPFEKDALAFAHKVVDLFRADESGPPDFDGLLEHVAELRDEAGLRVAERFANIKAQHR
jgi:hypothetical protein